MLRYATKLWRTHIIAVLTISTSEEKDLCLSMVGNMGEDRYRVFQLQLVITPLYSAMRRAAVITSCQCLSASKSSASITKCED